MTELLATNTQEAGVMRHEATHVTHLANLHHLDIFITGGAVMFSKDHTVGRPAGTQTETSGGGLVSAGVGMGRMKVTG